MTQRRFLVSVRARPPRRKFGALAGKLVVTDSFFDPLPAEELAAWETQAVRVLLDT